MKAFRFSAPISLALLASLAACGDNSLPNDSCFFPSPYLPEVRSKITSCAINGNIPSKVLLANAIYKDGNKEKAEKLYQEIAKIPGGQGLRELSRMENFSGMNPNEMLVESSLQGDLSATFIAFNRMESEGNLAAARSVIDSSPSKNIGRLASIARGSSKQPGHWRRAWTLKAAKAGDPASMHEYGSMLEHGIGVNIDKNEAARWYISSLEKDENLITLIDAARVYAGELGVYKNNNKALHLYERAKILSPYDSAYIDKKISIINGN